MNTSYALPNTYAKSMYPIASDNLITEYKGSRTPKRLRAFDTSQHSLANNYKDKLSAFNYNLENDIISAKNVTFRTIAYDTYS
jgi:hypothetical protein